MCILWFINHWINYFHHSKLRSCNTVHFILTTRVVSKSLLEQQHPTNHCSQPHLVTKQTQKYIINKITPTYQRLTPMITRNFSLHQMHTNLITRTRTHYGSTGRKAYERWGRRVLLTTDR